MGRGLEEEEGIFRYVFKIKIYDVIIMTFIRRRQEIDKVHLCGIITSS